VAAIANRCAHEVRSEDGGFTEYPLPTRGTEIRHVQVDNRTDPPTVWAPYNRTNKVVRIQFRAPVTQQQTQAAR
jgi:hypothetical protein